MAEIGKKEALTKRLAAMDKQEIVTKAVNKIAGYQEQIRNKDLLIADLMLQKEQSEATARQIIADATVQAEVLIVEAKKKAEIIEQAALTKLTNAAAEADAVLESRLILVKKDIDDLEARREEEKTKTMSLYNGLSNQYSEIIDLLSERVSTFRNAQDFLGDRFSKVESEEFTRFSMADYVSVPKEKATPEPIVSPHPVVPQPVLNIDHDDDSLDLLEGLLEEGGEEENVFDDGETDFDAFADDIDDYDFADFAIEEEAVVEEEFDQSFTGKFMKIPEVMTEDDEEEEIEEEEDFDFDGFEDILMDDEEEEDSAPAPTVSASAISVPDTKSKPATIGRWLT